MTITPSRSRRLTTPPRSRRRAPGEPRHSLSDPPPTLTPASPDSTPLDPASLSTGALGSGGHHHAEHDPGSFDPALHDPALAESAVLEPALSEAAFSEPGFTESAFSEPPFPGATGEPVDFEVPHPIPAADEVDENDPVTLRFRHAATGSRKGSRRAPVRRYYLGAALLRCGLYLGPLSVAVAAAGPLSRVAWPVPLITLLLGWTAAQALTSVGVAVARRGGPTAAARLIGGGFAAVAGLWSALVWITPAALLGPHRVLALVIGLGGLTSLATVTAALVTRSEAAIVRWSLPCWVLAGLALAELAGVALPVPLPIDTLLPAAIVVAAIRAFRPLMLAKSAKSAKSPGKPVRPTRAEIGRGAGYLVIGASQAVCVGMLWRGGPSGSTMPFWLPLLLAVPILEALIGWHTDQVEAALDTTENGADFGRQVRGVTLITLAGLLPPLAVGCALAVAAYRMPIELAALQGTRAGVLELAGGTLLGGVFAITFLLAARTRTGVAATMAATPPLAMAALPLLPGIPSAGALPDAVTVLAATHAVGLLVVALTRSDRANS
jgi:hypothetical protein